MIMQAINLNTASVTVQAGSELFEDYDLYLNTASVTVQGYNNTNSN